MSQVFVDSSVWVDYFRGVQTMATTALDGLLGRNEAVVGDLVLMEVLQGYRDLCELRSAEAALGRLDCFDLAGGVRVRKAAANYRRLRSVGVTPRSTIDVLIASFCAAPMRARAARKRAAGTHAEHARSSLTHVAIDTATSGHGA